MNALRLSSPLAWLGALFLFFLPWLDLRCSSQDGKEVSHTTFSGMQLAWGGETCQRQDISPKTTVIDLSVLIEDPVRLLAGCLLSLYLLGLRVAADGPRHEYKMVAATDWPCGCFFVL